MSAWSRILALVEATLSLLGLVVLARVRPDWPRLPSSLSAPVTTAMVEEFVLVALWVSIGLLLGLSILRAITIATTRSSRFPTVPPPGDRLASHLRARVGGVAPSTGPAFPPPFPIVPRGRAQHPPNGTPRHHSTPTDPRVPAVRPTIALLGPPVITGVTDLIRPKSKTRELLAYLVLNPQGATTDELVEALLPRTRSQTAKHRIWRSINEARSQLGDILPRSGDRYVLDRSAVTIDVDELDQLLARANAGTGAEREELLARAAALVRGEPLAGCTYAWAAGDERSLRGRIVALFSELAETRLAGGDAAAALTLAERALELVTADEPAHRLAMQAEFGLGLRDAIVERYNRLAQALDKQYGLEPEQETRALYRRLLSQDHTTQDPVSAR